MTVAAVAAVPTAPLLLPEVASGLPSASRAAIEALRGDVSALLAALPEVDVAVLLTAGDDTVVHDGAQIDLTGSGHPHVRRTVGVDRRLVAQIATRAGVPRVHDDRLRGDAAVLAFLLAAARPELDVVPVTIADRSGPLTLVGFASGLASALASAATSGAAPVGDAGAAVRRSVVIAAGDLAATRDVTSPGYVVDGAVAFDAAVADAVDATDPAALAALGAGEAQRVAARGWAPLVVAMHVARHTGLATARVAVHAPRGVGQLLASTTAWPTP